MIFELNTQYLAFFASGLRLAGDAKYKAQGSRNKGQSTNLVGVVK